MCKRKSFWKYCRVYVKLFKNARTNLLRFWLHRCCVNVALIFCNGQVKVRTLIQLKCCGRTWSNQLIGLNSRVEEVMNWGMGKISYKMLCMTEKLSAVITAKWGHTSYWKQWLAYFCNVQMYNNGSVMLCWSKETQESDYQKSLLMTHKGKETPRHLTADEGLQNRTLFK